MPKGIGYGKEGKSRSGKNGKSISGKNGKSGTKPDKKKKKGK